MDKGKNLAKIAKIVCIFAGLIFGAGFASGQEHLTFFLRYGHMGIFGIILAGLIIALCGWAVLAICVREGIGDYKTFMGAVFGRKLGAVLDVVTGLFIFVIFAAMLAGAGAMGQQALNLPFSAGAFILAVLSFGVLLFGIDGIVKANAIITPILVVGALFMGILAIFNRAEPAITQASQSTIMWPFSAIVYASYNMITAVAVLAAMPNLATSPKIARWGGLLGGGLIAIIGVIFVVALLANLPIVQDAQLPMLALGQSFAPAIAYGYTVLLFLAIFTTAVTNAFALTNWLASRTKFSKAQIRIGISALGVTAAHLGFSTMVSYGYTAFGFFGVFIVFAIILRGGGLLFKKR
ncbi:MAG: hypothetical protein FWE21_06820 [Defluviitaleaceae bacterium]|nr:hypothetical protein [Defluviitaleaceae bacterium]